MNVSVTYNSFIGGELSPLMAARIDAPNYSSGAKRIQNAVPLLTGGLRKRPGTWYFSDTAYGTLFTSLDERVFIIAWLLTDGMSLLLEVSFHYDGAKFVLLIVIYMNVRADQKILLSIDWPDGPAVPDLRKVRYAIGNGVVPDKTSRNFILFTSEEYRQMIVLKANPVGEGYNFNGVTFDLINGPTHVRDIAFYGGRLYLGGMKESPTRIMASRPPDSLTGNYRYNDFTAGALAGDAIVIDENDMSGGGVQWIFGGRRFLTATERTSWQDTGETPVPGTFDMNIVEYAGSAPIKPAASKEIVVYAGRGSKTLRALVWRYGDSGGGYMDIDLGAAAAHLFDSDITSYAVMDYPFPTIWIATGAGELISCSINMSSGIAAFARHTLGSADASAADYGFVESVEVSRQESGDKLYLAVRRNQAHPDDPSHLIPVRCIEYLELQDLINADYTESHHVDSGVRVEFPEGQESSVITGLERFIGMKVNIFADGSLFAPATVDGEGRIRLTEKIKKAHIGLPVKTLISLNSAQLPANGTSFGKKRRIEKAVLTLFKSIGGSAGTREQNGEPVITQRFGNYAYGQPVEPYTGNIDLYIGGTVDNEGTLHLVHDESAPFTVLAVTERIAVLET